MPSKQTGAPAKGEQLRNFHSSLTSNLEPEAVAEALCADLNSRNADLAVVFLSHHHGPEFSQVCEELHKRLNARNLIGCTGESIAGPTEEVEGRPAAVLWCAKLPNTRIIPFVIDQGDLARMTEPQDWHDHLGVVPSDDPDFIVLPEPYSIRCDAAVAALSAVYEGANIVGGVVSGANGPGQNAMILGDLVLKRGMVGVSICGDTKLQPIVSQGCRPIGKRFVVTKARQNWILELGGQPAFHALKQMFDTAAPADRMLIKGGLHIGVVIDELNKAPGVGDFLIRNLLKGTEKEGLETDTIIKPGKTVQFHVRDAEAADEELRTLVLAHHLCDSESAADSGPAGVLMFSCNGRGSRMFGRAGHDVDVLNELWPRCSVAGFFAQGEFGPVGGQTFLHSFTCSLAMFGRKSSRQGTEIQIQ
jgi:small ligand-binding sensory domain FIST